MGMLEIIGGELMQLLLFLCCILQRYISHADLFWFKEPTPYVGSKALALFSMFYKELSLDYQMAVRAAQFLVVHNLLICIHCYFSLKNVDCSLYHIYKD